MLNKFKRAAVLLITILFAFTAFVPAAGAGLLSSYGAISGLPHRRNDSTGFYAVIADEARLLSVSEENKLLEQMYPLTQYANIAVYTVDSPTSLRDYERASIKREELFGKSADAAVFTIDMYLRRVVIQRKGVMEKYFNNSRANNITNNVTSYLKSKEYYSACSTGLDQMLSVIEDRSVPQPMKYLSNGVIALMFGCLTAVIVAAVTSTTLKKAKEKKGAAVASVTREAAGLALAVESFKLVRSYTVDRSSSSSGSSCSSSSCSSCSSSSSCSSCSSGSSCGGSSF